MKLRQRCVAPDVAPRRGWLATRAFVIACVAVSSLLGVGVADAKPRRKAAPVAAPAPPPPAAPTPNAGPGPGPAPAKADGPTGDKKERVQNIDLTGIDLNGHNRTPQLLYFLERANEELERASLEKRSFIPNMAKSVEDESL